MKTRLRVSTKRRRLLPPERGDCLRAGRDGLLAYKKAIDAFYQDEGARAFMQWFERNVTRALPMEMVIGVTVVLRKRAVG